MLQASSLRGGVGAARAPGCNPRNPAALRAAQFRGAGVQRLRARRQLRRLGRSWRAAAASWGGAGEGGGSGSGWPHNSTERQRVLTKFVQDADPELMQQFESDAHPEVIIAMRQTITSMLGTLPPQFFRVVISTEAENLAQLMCSVLMSGYMFSNAWTRLSLTQSMAEQPLAGLLESERARRNGGGNLATTAASSSSLSSVGGSLDSMDSDGLQPAPQKYAPGSQKRGVEGEVLRWHHDNGKEVVPALQYIEQLEKELAVLRQQMEAQQAAHEQASAAAAKLRPMPGNELLEYLKCLTPEELVSLTDCASEDVIDAMNLFVQRLMGMEAEAWQGGSSDCTASELAQLMYWLMITGYSLRQLEQRCDLTRTLELPAPGQEPPPPSLPAPGL